MFKIPEGISNQSRQIWKGLSRHARAWAYDFHRATDKFREQDLDALVESCLLLGLRDLSQEFGAILPFPKGTVFIADKLRARLSQ